MSRLACFFLLLGLACWGGCPSPSRAQDDPDTDSGTDPQLPEIAPREFEIRGQAQVSFPSLERQPLRGFASPPSIPTVPPQRQPFVDADGYKQTLEDIPNHLPDAPAVSSRLQSAPPLTRGSLAADLGRYLTRSVDGVLAVPLTGTETVAVEARYDGSSSYTAFDDTGVETPYDNVAGRVRFETRRERISFAADVHGFVDTYTLYGAQAPVGVPLDPAIPDRSGRSIGTSFRLDTSGRVPGTLGLTFDRTRYETDPDTLTAAIPFDESRLALDGAIEVPVGVTNARFDVSFATAGLDGGAFAGDVVSFDGGGDALVVRMGPYRVRAGLRLLAFNALLDPSADDAGDATATFLAPAFDASWQPLPTLSVYARNIPRLRTHDLPTLYGRNPFLGPAPSVRPTLETTNLESGVDVTTGPVRWQAFGGFRYAPSYLYFAPTAEDLGAGPAVRNLFTAAYDGARIWRAGGEVALEGLTTTHATLRMELRDATLTDTDRAIPNVPAFLLEGTTTLTFADGKATVSLGASVESPRYIDARQDEQVGTFVDVDADASYAITPIIDLRLGVHNLGAVERWDRYPRPSAVVTTGFRIHW